MYHINILIRGGHGPRFTNENSFNKQLQEKFIIFFNVLVFILHMGLRHFGISSAQPYAGDPFSAVGFYRQMEVRK